MTVWAKWSDDDQSFLFSDSDNGGTELTPDEYDTLMAGLHQGQILVSVDGAPVLAALPAAPPPAIWAKWVEQDQRFLFLDRDNGGLKITVEEHAELLQGQAGGQVLALSENDYPMLIDPPKPSPDFLASVERLWRDGQLAETDGVVSRHRDELEESQETTLTADQYAELQSYRRALRNWPEAGEFPLIEHRPPTPLWLAGQIE
ncbi:hypothetical protein [Pseudomonas sp. S3E12]|uniref:hypothetical protein n=1 Tax=Pseudomonas sp. S3E12 TaxID=1873126 RepID=UPI00081C2379|nr:hypothetical protein [Pseudomonas sp. S3E12]OCW22340.1 hypothetical protein BB029_16645 [Pseudomonas sp. S3E12]